MSNPRRLSSIQKKWMDGQILRRNCGWVKAWLPLSYPSKSYDLSCCSSRWPFLWSESDWTLGGGARHVSNDEHGTPQRRLCAEHLGVQICFFLDEVWCNLGHIDLWRKQRWWQLWAHPACLEFRSFLRTGWTPGVTWSSEPAGRLFPWSSGGSAACLVKSRYGWYLLSCGGHLEHPKRERSDPKFRSWYGERDPSKSKSWWRWVTQAARTCYSIWWYLVKMHIEASFPLYANQCNLNHVSQCPLKCRYFLEFEASASPEYQVNNLWFETSLRVKPVRSPGA